MLRICQRWAILGFVSVLSLAKRALGSKAAAVWLKIGPKVLQGPHHGAQQSTGISFLLSVAATFPELSSKGFPVNSGFLHFPQTGLSFKRSFSRLLVAKQCGQLMCMA